MSLIIALLTIGGWLFGIIIVFGLLAGAIKWMNDLPITASDTSNKKDDTSCL